MEEIDIAIDNDIKEAVRVLRRGGIILYPTDTVWGIGCDACNAEAVERVYALKKRVDSKALITLVDSLAMLERIVEEVPDVAYQMMEVTDRPLTIVYDHGRGVAQNLMADDGSIGVRLTDDVFCRRLIGGMRSPLVSTSANMSGEPSATVFSEISPDIVEGVDYVVSHRRDETVNTVAPSMVMRISAGGVFKILRS